MEQEYERIIEECSRISIGFREKIVGLNAEIVSLKARLKNLESEKFKKSLFDRCIVGKTVIKMGDWIEHLVCSKKVYSNGEKYIYFADGTKIESREMEHGCMIVEDDQRKEK